MAIGHPCLSMVSDGVRWPRWPRWPRWRRLTPRAAFYPGPRPGIIKHTQTIFLMLPSQWDGSQVFFGLRHISILHKWCAGIITNKSCNFSNLQMLLLRLAFINSVRVWPPATFNCICLEDLLSLVNFRYDIVFEWYYIAVGITTKLLWIALSVNASSII